MRWLLPLFLAFCLQAQEVFLVQPYLQLGDAPKVAARERLDLLWHAGDEEAAWSVEVRGTKGWTVQSPPAFRRLEAPPLAPHRVYRVTLRNLPPGSAVPYRVKRQGKVVFEAEAQTRKPGAHRMVVFGDAADGSRDQSAIAKAVLAAQPDAVFITGDLVYGRGRASEYRAHFFPVYNGEAAPLMRRTPFLGVVGNHDVPFAGFPDASAYFAYWSQPLNGPALQPGAKNAAPVKAGVHDAIVAASGPAFPRMASFSFDYGQVHWTVLDSNGYADWDSPPLRAWLEADLRAAKGAAWRIVALHHPLFQSARSHSDDQWMRPISPLLEKYGVDLVLAGHVHNYQRTAPLRFQPTQVGLRGKPVVGEFTVDEAFDGRTVTRARGPIHVVTGAGGAELYDPWQTDAKASWQPWTRAFVSDKHSFTVLDVAAKTLTLRQLDAEGRELDAITLTK
ncbi:MAG: metallophosphoesterase [Geothrix sp.]|uniref:metallophosphoesterase n=1 Tax=Geothrix sp. TaxID=1962974 RepID=UPI0017E5487E|nr:metallophosphoesterase [Geothrix sp.]NWJ40877.1 metallophosphoesterase [Geothrix sp.]WIL21122.1 MAG: metallophosphoesterase [Geothrix sp.]